MSIDLTPIKNDLHNAVANLEAEALSGLQGGPAHDAIVKLIDDGLDAGVTAMLSETPLATITPALLPFIHQAIDAEVTSLQSKLSDLASLKALLPGA